MPFVASELNDHSLGKLPSSLGPRHIRPNTHIRPVGPAALYDTDDQGRRTVMLVASLQVAASKCCHAAAMPAGGPHLAAGRNSLSVDSDETTEPLLSSRRTRPAARPVDPDRSRSRGFLSTCDSLRLAHRRDEERTDTWNTSGMCYRFFLPERGTLESGGDDEEGAGREGGEWR